MKIGSAARWGAAMAFGTALAGTPAASGGSAGEVNVYSYRQQFLVEPLFEAFTRETGIRVNVVFAKKGMIARLQAEGANSPADLLFTVDVGRLDEAYKAGVTQPVGSTVLENNIPAQYRHAGGHWFGMTTRVRIIYASKERVRPDEITTYEDLADPKWRGRICSRSGKNSYNVGLIAAMIAHHGEAKAETWLAGVKANLARKPQGNDRAQVKAIREGQCDLAIGNHYYFGKMLHTEEQQPWAEAVFLVFPNQQDRGAHVNVSGVAMTASAPNRDNALRLMEFLSGPGQTLYAEQNFEYPVRPGVPWLPEVEAWGRFTTDALAIGVIAELRAQAVRMVDRVDFDG